MTNLTIGRGFLGIVAASLVTPAIAQQEEPVFMEEIVVTSTKRETTLQAVPVAVSVVHMTSMLNRLNKARGRYSGVASKAVMWS